MNPTKNPAPAATGNGAHHCTLNSNTTSRPASMEGDVTRAPSALPATSQDSEGQKQARLLTVFALGQALCRFDAERLGDHVLPTSIANLQQRHDLKFSRERRKVPNRFGQKTSVMFYWLEGAEITKACQALARLKGSQP